MDSATVQPSAKSAALLRRGKRFAPLALGLLLGALAGIGATKYQLLSWGAPSTFATTEHADAHGHEEGGEDAHSHGNDGHDHSHEDDLTLVELSQQARGNIGLKVQAVNFSTFTRTVTVPAIVVERPGQSQMDVVAPLTGVVTKIYVIPGQAVEPGQPLFDLRLTHEELVQGQGDYLKTLEELDVVNREIRRLKKVAEEGAIAGKVVLEREYEAQKFEAIQRAQEQALGLHGLSPEQIASIRQTRTLLSALTVTAPKPSDGKPAILQVASLNVEPGKQIMAGEAMCRLADHRELYVEGKAFQQDAELLNDAARKGADVCALMETADEKPQEVCNLKILYLANSVDPTSRLFSFFATLPNELVRDDKASDGRRYVDWQFRPGQRLQLKVPVETWNERIVLPVDAVVQEGPESYVFREDGDHFHRCPIHIEYRDQFSVVLGEGSDIFPGDRLAMNGAQQLHLALKNKSGGGIDPHAGHNH